MRDSHERERGNSRKNFWRTRKGSPTVSLLVGRKRNHEKEEAPKRWARKRLPSSRKETGGKNDKKDDGE